MDFKIRYKRELIASLIAMIIAFCLLNFYGSKDHIVIKSISCLSILSFLLGRYIYYVDDGYVIKDDKIIINSENKVLRISKISPLIKNGLVQL